MPKSESDDKMASGKVDKESNNESDGSEETERDSENLICDYFAVSALNPLIYGALDKRLFSRFKKFGKTPHWINGTKQWRQYMRTSLYTVYVLCVHI